MPVIRPRCVLKAGHSSVPHILATRTHTALTAGGGATAPARRPGRRDVQMTDVCSVCPQPRPGHRAQPQATPTAPPRQPPHAVSVALGALSRSAFAAPVHGVRQSEAPGHPPHALLWRRRTI